MCLYCVLYFHLYKAYIKKYESNCIQLFISIYYLQNNVEILSLILNILYFIAAAEVASL